MRDSLEHFNNLLDGWRGRSWPVRATRTAWVDWLTQARERSQFFAVRRENSRVLSSLTAARRPSLSRVDIRSFSSDRMAARPPLPFGLGRDPQCAPHRCLSPDTPLPAPGTPLHDQIAAALSQLFQTFFSTSLRYLGVSEILDWLETSGTVDAWILSGLEGGRLPDEIADERNLAFGKEAFRQVVKNALDADGGAWATSLRETGFSSAMSMAFEGVIAQVRPLPRHFA